MAKPWVHAESSARKFGGKPEDYMPIHNLMDSSKSAIPLLVHRVIFHNSWAIGPDGILEQVFGPTITNSDGKQISVRLIGEQHILEDFGGRFIPTLQDYLCEMSMPSWMQNGKDYPPSCKQLKTITRTIKIGD